MTRALPAKCLPCSEAPWKDSTQGMALHPSFLPQPYWVGHGGDAR